MVSRLVLLLLLLAAGMAGTDNPGIFGVWWRGGPDPAAIKAQAPFVKGVFVALRWRDLEPEDGRYNWPMFDQVFAKYARSGLYIQYMVWVGPDSPRWIYAAGVPEVRTTPTRNPHGELRNWTYPFYLDARYKKFYQRMLRAVAAHVDSLPTDVRNRVVCIQTAEGTTGDEGGYKGDPLDAKYVLSRDQWNAFKFETWKLFNDLYRSKNPPIHILINSGNGGQYNDWLNTNMPNAWRKAGNPGHGYELNDEKNMMAFFDPLINHPESGRQVRVRSEMDEMFKGWFQEAPVWNMYWLNLWGLHFGLDIFQHETAAFENRAFDKGFRFYAKYAGRKDPANSPGAWCALHDGLDAADFERFPAAEYGSGSLHGTAGEQAQGLERTLKIAQAFSAYGAAQGDPDKGMKVVMQNRDAQRMNDVGWNIESGNYERYLHQWNANGTSRGYWRQGPKDQPYGRFARGFDSKSARNTMYFTLDDRFFSKSSSKAVWLRIIYLDRGPGAFDVKYDEASNPEKTAARVKKTDSGRWKEAVVRIADGKFGHRCPHGTDVMLVNASGENTLFHLVEITRE
jgi:hypothetical protein